MNRRIVLPWIVVTVILVIAIAASVTVITLSKQGDSDSSATQQTTAAETDASSASAEASDDASSSAAVQPANTYELEISSWSVTIYVPEDLGQISFSLSDSNTLDFSAAKESELPSECSAMVGGWGIQRSEGSGDEGSVTVGDYSYTLVTPTSSCSSDPELVSTITELYEDALASIQES
ncbi:MAG TPA: hypothetical protein GX406_03930 [Pseudoclavibacter sp.]|nr:hypothetical protein [Pseudoclavibacter sp.]